MIKKTSDKKLLAQTQALIDKERKTLEQILEYLQEIQRRRLFADLGYSSLFKYMVKELKYSEGAAARRIGALRLVEKIPAAKKMIASGELNLTVASQAQNFCKNRSINDTRSILEKVKNKTKDQATVEFLKLEPGSTAAAERRVRVSAEDTRIHMTIKDKTLEKLEKVKALKKMSSDEAINYAMEKVLTSYEKELKITRKSKGTKGRNISARVKKHVLLRAKMCCESPGCSESRQLEFEHVIPFAKGGKHEIKNIKLFCRTHNQRAAILEYGQGVMDVFLN